MLKRILHVTASMNPELGGVCQAIRTLIKGLEELNIHNEVVCLDSSQANFVTADNFPVHAVGPASGPWAYASTLVPWLLINVSRFNVIILHGLWLYPNYAVRKALIRYHKEQKKQVDPKLFIMPHGMLDPYFQKTPGRRLKAIRNWAYWKIIEAKVVNDADGLLFTCEEERLLAQKPFRPYKPKQEMVVGLGVEAPPLFTPAMRNDFLAKCPALQNQPYILFLSRIHEKKGVDLLIAAYAKLVRNTTKNKAGASSNGVTSVAESVMPAILRQELPKLVIAGPGLDTPYGVQMQQLVSESEELKNAVIFPGMLTGNAKWGAFYGCEAFILPSHQENFGIAVVEALACGKPVLVSNQVNIWREIENEGAGLIAVDTPSGTFDLLNNWQQLSQEEKQKIISKTRITYEKQFDINSNVDRLLKAISN